MPPSRSRKEWFRAGWFGSRYYPLLYGHRNEEEAAFFITRLLEFLRLSHHAHILDAPCGNGRHAREICRNGFTVTGIDLSHRCITTARHSCIEHATFRWCDLRDLATLNLGVFECAVNLFTSLGYFDEPNDNLRVLTGFKSVLQPAGRLVIDFFNAAKVIRNLVSEEEKVVDGVRFMIRRAIEDGFIVKRIRVIDDRKKGTLRRYGFMEKVQALDLAIFKNMLSMAGFTITDIYGDYQLAGPFNEHESDRLIIIARK